MFSRRFFLLGTLVVVIAAGGCEVQIQAQRTTQLIEGVQVIGNRRLTKEDILTHVQTKPGEVYSAKQVQRDLEAVLEMGVFDKTQTQVFVEPGFRGGPVVNFEVVELPLILNIAFEGLRGIKETTLLEALQREHVAVAKGAVYDPVQVRKAMRVIKKFLAPRGWPNAAVTVTTEYVTSQSVSLTFVIKREVSFEKVG